MPRRVPVHACTHARCTVDVMGTSEQRNRLATSRRQRDRNSCSQRPFREFSLRHTFNTFNTVKPYRDKGGSMSCSFGFSTRFYVAVIKEAASFLAFWCRFSFLSIPVERFTFGIRFFFSRFLGSSCFQLAQNGSLRCACIRMVKDEGELLLETSQYLIWSSGKVFLQRHLAAREITQ